MHDANGRISGWAPPPHSHSLSNAQAHNHEQSGRGSNEAGRSNLEEAGSGERSEKNDDASGQRGNATSQSVAKKMDRGENVVKANSATNKEIELLQASLRLYTLRKTGPSLSVMF